MNPWGDATPGEVATVLPFPVRLADSAIGRPSLSGNLSGVQGQGPPAP